MTPPWLQALLSALQAELADFEDTLRVIDEHFLFNPTAFSIDQHHNAAHENQGACRVLALAAWGQLSVDDVLLLFGRHARAVLAHPEGTDHRNIRALLAHGMDAVAFEHFPLISRG